METRVKGLFAAGEAVGGANGANRLSGNAITEAFVFGERAGRFAAAGLDACLWTDEAGESALAQLVTPSCADTQTNLGRLMPELQSLLWDKVGLLRDQAHLQAALDRLRDMRVTELPALRPSASHTFEIEMQDWFDLRSALLTAEAIALAALKRTESRGAHQREDHPATDPAQERNQTIRLVDGALSIAWRDVVRKHVEPQPLVMAK
jgi:succinate dehydrogenase/fumarate reductase flavoprotein subunit